MDKLVKVILIFVALLISFSICYYFVFFLPQNEKVKLKLQKEEQLLEEQQIDKERLFEEQQAEAERLFEEQQIDKEQQKEERIIDLQNQAKANQQYLLNDCLDKVSKIGSHLRNTQLALCFEEAELLKEEYYNYKATMTLSDATVTHLGSLEKDFGAKVAICGDLQNYIYEIIGAGKEECFRKYPQD